jgi:hypothetical protein
LLGQHGGLATRGAVPAACITLRQPPLTFLIFDLNFLAFWITAFFCLSSVPFHTFKPIMSTEDQEMMARISQLAGK